MQNDLLDLLIADAPVDELLAKVASLVMLPILLLDGTGAPVGFAGTRDPAPMAVRAWRAWAAATPSWAPMGFVEDGEARFICREIVLYGKVERLLVAGVQHTSSTEFAHMALSFLQRLVTLDLLRRRDEIVATQRLRQRLLRELVSGTSTAEELTAWVSEHGLDLREPWRLALCEIQHQPGAPRRPMTEQEDALTEAADTFLGDRLIPFLSRPGRRSLSLLLPNGSAAVGAGSARDLLLVFKAYAAGEPYGVTVTIGASAAQADPLAGPRAFQEATDAAAAAAARRGCARARAVRGDERPLPAACRPERGRAGRRRPPHHRTPHRLRPAPPRPARRDPAGLAGHHWAIQPTAEALYVHRNTLQKRLRRIEALLGMDLQDPDDIVELYLGLRATQLLGEDVVVRRAPG